MIRKSHDEEASALEWRKSSHSGGTEGDSCVEVAATPTTVHIRDSKDTSGPRLAVAPQVWARFLGYARKP
ncbi:DUF397 domain-containing protein [Streptomyces sp. CC53]|uniref:DUF397 domain-containing protein n=1 Tax=unclassified Streptomyces TaxID=2593676 RepID=UPI0008DC642F|nr:MULTISPECIES: DUF397 domain-containing protein [unclassified Streptomyces]OII61753.1 DUF397 domain-containing protein [Streptomyces sp. CC53]OII64488.1 DUF397 domain-containing protein [Streptomyces sp. CC77]